MRLSPRLLSLVAGSAAVSALGIGCGGTQTLAPAQPVATSGPAVQITVAARTPPNNTNVTTPGEEPLITTVQNPVEPYPPEDIPVDCGRG